MVEGFEKIVNVMKERIKQFRVGIIIGIMLILALIGFDQSRSVYCLSQDKCITVWKRMGNKCYLVPGKYYGLGKPSEYILTTNDNALTIVYDTLSQYDFTLLNEYGRTIEINIYSKKVLFFRDFEREYFYNKYLKFGNFRENISYLKIDIKENLVIVNGVKK